MTPRRFAVAVTAAVAIPTGCTDPGYLVDVEYAAPDIPPVSVEQLVDPAVAVAPARRVDVIETMAAPTSTWVLPPPAPTGLFGLPFAPAGLDDCETATFYRQQFGLPAVFDRLAYRESRCIQAEQVRTWCCVGRWQLWVDLHLDNDVLALRYEECGVHSEWDVDGPEPLEQQRAACATKALYDVAGMSPWRTT